VVAAAAATYALESASINISAMTMTSRIVVMAITYQYENGYSIATTRESMFATTWEV
jgi:hypothetical protein